MPAAARPVPAGSPEPPVTVGFGEAGQTPGRDGLHRADAGRELPLARQWSANDAWSAWPAIFSAAAAFLTAAPMPKNSCVTPV